MPYSTYAEEQIGLRGDSRASLVSCDFLDKRPQGRVPADPPSGSGSQAGTLQGGGWERPTWLWSQRAEGSLKASTTQCGPHPSRGPAHYGHDYPWLLRLKTSFFSDNWTFRYKKWIAVGKSWHPALTGLAYPCHLFPSSCILEPNPLPPAFQKSYILFLSQVRGIPGRRLSKV